MDSSVEYAIGGGILLLHFNGLVHKTSVNFNNKSGIVESFKRIATELPIPREDLATIATDVIQSVKKHWGVQDYAINVTSGIKAVHPVKGSTSTIDVATIIMDLNDCHGWTREQIADWLDTLPQQPVFKIGDNIITAEDLK